MRYGKQYNRPYKAGKKAKTMYSYNIMYVNSYGHIIANIFTGCKTDKAAITKAKQYKSLYPECHIEIINLDTRKRIYANRSCFLPWYQLIIVYRILIPGRETAYCRRKEGL
jgi:hypothetical protein